MVDLSNVLKDWPKHPVTGRRTAALVGMAQTTRHKAPFDDPGVAIIGINESYSPVNSKRNDKGELDHFLKRWDAWFQVHPSWDAFRDYNFNHRNHGAWLLNTPDACGHCADWNDEKSTTCPDCHGTRVYTPERRLDFPIYVIFEDMLEGIPGAVMYPYDAIKAFYQLDDDTEWFESTLDFEIALLGYLGFEEIQFWGYEMSSGTEYASQKASAMHWIGWLRGLGVKIVLPEDTGFMGAQRERYALDKVPGYYTGMHAEIATMALRTELEHKIAEVNSIRGKKQLISQQLQQGGQQKGRRQKLIATLTALTDAEVKALLNLATTSGAHQHAERVEKELKAQTTKEGGKLNVPKMDFAFQAIDHETGNQIVAQSDALLTAEAGKQTELHDQLGLEPLEEILDDPDQPTG